MNIEEEIFKKHIVKKNLLEKYGFKKIGNKFALETKLSKENFKVLIEYDGKFNGKIFDISADEEYTNFRIENSNGFSAKIREEYINILTDIRDKCAEKQLFKTQQMQNICKYITEKYNDFPEFLWEKLPDYCIFRNKKNKKWYAIVGTVQLNKVDKSSASAKIVEIINVKVDKDKIQEILKINGIYEAYHMNKKNWVTIILDKTLTDSEIIKFVDESYNNI